MCRKARPGVPLFLPLVFCALAFTSSCSESGESDSAATEDDDGAAGAAADDDVGTGDDDGADDDTNPGADDDVADDDVADDDAPSPAPADDDPPAPADDDSDDDQLADDDAPDDDDDAPASGGRSGTGDDDEPAGEAGSGGDDDVPAPVATADGLCGAAEGQLFDASHPWNQPIVDVPLDAESDAIVSYLYDNHESSQLFRIDGPSEYPNDLYGITVLTADEGTEAFDFSESGDFYSPDCDHVPIPLPEGGAIEGEQSYACDSDGDCHLIIIDTSECRLFEMWRANRSGDSFEGGCLAVWDLTAPYQETLRGDCCTSADAAGLPIAAHMFNADEIAAGVIDHAIRFILPNELMRERIYVRPATHSTGATSGGPDAPPYGSRLRLRADVDLDAFNPAAQVVLRALQTYGMILSDGGNVTFTATNDRFTETKWADVGLGPNDLTGLEWSDFEVPELGERYTWDDSCSCDRTPLTE